MMVNIQVHRRCDATTPNVVSELPYTHKTHRFPRMILRFVPESMVCPFDAERLYNAPSDVGPSALPALRRGLVGYGEHPE